MKINYSKKLLVAFAVVNFILVGVLYYWFIFQRYNAEEMDLRCNTKILESNLIGQLLPKYEFVNSEGTDIYQGLTQGKVLIVVFLTNCQACLSEFDFLERHYSEISSEIKIAAITAESSGVVEQFVDARKLSFPTYLDVRGGLMLKTRVACTPTMLFLENGIVRKVKVGKINNYKDLMEGFKL